jgi:O-antigen ligase
MRFSDPGAWARAAFFALLAPFAAGGAIGVPVLFGVASVFQLRPSLALRALKNPPLWLIALFLFAIWAAISGVWAPAAAVETTLKLALLLLLGLIFVGAAGAQETRHLTQAGGIAAFAVLAALLGIEALFDMPFIRSAQPGVEPGRLAATLTRGGTVLLALTWPAVASLIAQDRPYAARFAWLASGFLAFQFSQLAAVVAFAVGLVVFFVAPKAPRLALFGVTGSWAGWLLAAPFLTPILLSSQELVARLPASWEHRARIWRYVCERIYEQPWLGYGLDASRAADERVPLHPHSGSLQIWYETGAVGAALSAVALIAGGWALSRALAHDRLGAASAAATIASLGVVANVSYGVWQEWWIATMFIAAACAAAVAAGRSVDFGREAATNPQP